MRAGTAQSSHMILKRGADRGRAQWKQYLSFEISKSTPSGTPPPIRPHLLTPSNSSTNWEPSIQTWAYGSHCHSNHHTAVGLPSANHTGSSFLFSHSSTPCNPLGANLCTHQLSKSVKSIKLLQNRTNWSSCIFSYGGVRY